MKPFRSLCCKTMLLFSGAVLTFNNIALAQTGKYQALASEVTAKIHEDYWMESKSLYRKAIDSNDPEMIWGAGVLFSMLAGASRHEPKTYKRDMLKNFDAMDAFWDEGVDIPGYEPAPTRGGGNDKYYDDNAWMVLTFTEAYELYGQRKHIRRAYDTLVFVISGWDDTLDGGIWWHEKHKAETKNTCANAPAAVGCLMLAKHRKDRSENLVKKAKEIVAWTKENLQAEDGLYSDSIHAETKKINHAKLTYNTALMLRAELMLYRITRDEAHLREAVRMGKAADKLCHSGTAIYRDPPKWSHLMVEADLELFRQTGDKRALERAKANGDAYYSRWKSGEETKLLEIASIARALWLLADHESPAGREFWKKVDSPGN